MGRPSHVDASRFVRKRWWPTLLCGLAMSVAWACVLVGCKRDQAPNVNRSEPSTEPMTLDKPPTFVGSAVCATCHEAQHRAWMGSHHGLAMQEATEQTVLGDFSGQTLAYFDETVSFEKDGSRFLVKMLDERGERRAFEVRFAFGVSPLQQYLVETAPGRLQALTVAWDTRASAEGGGRWFHLQSDEYVGPGDPLHWTGAAYNWNHACADCHSTHVDKGFDVDTGRYATTYSEVDVGCEACHGAGSQHVALAERDPDDVAHAKRDPDDVAHAKRDPDDVAHAKRDPDDVAHAKHDPDDVAHAKRDPDDVAHAKRDPDDVALAKRNARHAAHTEHDSRNVGTAQLFLPATDRAWRFSGGRDIATLSGSASENGEVERCATCHARRRDFGGPANVFHDRYRLSLLEPTLYFNDGQIRDEVFVYGSFLQSKMHRAGVVCSDCHEPHGLSLRAEGDVLCGQCHRESTYGGRAHSFHATESGVGCVDCHMPGRIYMQLDDRADHRFGVPRPALSNVVGSPDPCTGCHATKNHAWAQRAIDAHFGQSSVHDFAMTLHRARTSNAANDGTVTEELARLVRSKAAPAVVRATAMGEWAQRAAIPRAVLQSASSDASPLVRRAALDAVRGTRGVESAPLLRAFLRDPVRSLRIEAASTLLGADKRTWPRSDQEAFARACLEFAKSARFNADQSGGLLALARIAVTDGDREQAIKWLRMAIEKDKTYTPAYVNLADVYRQLGDDAAGLRVLQDAIHHAADRASVEHGLGLALVRADRKSEAVAHLKAAHRLRPDIARFGYVYAIAEYDLGRGAQAIRVLRHVHQRHDHDLAVLALLRDYTKELGRTREAGRYQRKIDELQRDR